MRRIKNAKMVRGAAILFLSLFHIRALWPLITASKYSSLRRLLAQRPQIWTMVLTPYLAAPWGPSMRLRRIVDHCRTVERLGGVVDFPADSYVELCPIPEIAPDLRVVLDQAPWLLRDGQLVLSLWYGTDRAFSLAFYLSSESGDLRAYVGAVQGASSDMVDRYRTMTRAAHGMRPRDLLIEIFLILARHLGTTQITCVSDRTMQQKSSYYQGQQSNTFVSYDDTWKARGGRLDSDNFFHIPLERRRRESAEIPSRKRSMYRRRYAMLDRLEERISSIICAGLMPGMLKSHPGETLRTQADVSRC